MSESPLKSRKGGTIHRLRSRVHDFEPFLTMSGEWRLADVDVDQRRGRPLVMSLLNNGALESRDPTKAVDGNYPLVYRWRPGAKTQMQGWIDDTPSMPECDCRQHVPPDLSREAETCHCKHCGKQYDAERLREYLS